MEGESFAGLSISFTTTAGFLALTSIMINGKEYINQTGLVSEVPLDVKIYLYFTEKLDPETITSDAIRLTDNAGLIGTNITLPGDSSVIQNIYFQLRTK